MSGALLFFGHILESSGGAYGRSGAELRRPRRPIRRCLLAKPNVVGVGTGYRTVGKQTTDQVCLVTLVRRKIPRAGLTAQELVPAEVGGVPTDVLEVGTCASRRRAIFAGGRRRAGSASATSE